MNTLYSKQVPKSVEMTKKIVSINPADEATEQAVDSKQTTCCYRTRTM